MEDEFELNKYKFEEKKFPDDKNVDYSYGFEPNSHISFEQFINNRSNRLLVYLTLNLFTFSLSVI